MSKPLSVEVHKILSADREYMEATVKSIDFRHYEENAVDNWIKVYDSRLNELDQSPGAIQEFELILQKKRLLLEITIDYLTNMVTNFKGVANDSNIYWTQLNANLKMYKDTMRLSKW